MGPIQLGRGASNLGAGELLLLSCLSCLQIEPVSVQIARVAKPIIALFPAVASPPKHDNLWPCLEVVELQQFLLLHVALWVRSARARHARS
jgi:hypothetical protein